MECDQHEIVYISVSDVARLLSDILDCIPPSYNATLTMECEHDADNIKLGDWASLLDGILYCDTGNFASIA